MTTRKDPRRVQVPCSVDMVSRPFGMCVCVIGVRRALLTSYQDIRNLLSDWADEIHQCERIWIRASASNRRIFLGYDDAVIAKGKSPWRSVGVLFTDRTRRRAATDVPLSYS